MRSFKKYSTKKIIIGVVVVTMIIGPVSILLMHKSEEGKPPKEQLVAVDMAMQSCLTNRKVAGFPGTRRNLGRFMNEIWYTLKRVGAPEDKISRCGTISSLAKYGFLIIEEPDVIVSYSDDGSVFMAYTQIAGPTTACEEREGIKIYSVRQFYNEGLKTSATTQCFDDGSVPQITQIGKVYQSPKSQPLMHRTLVN